MLFAWDAARRALVPAPPDTTSPWVHAVAPTPDEQEQLQRTFGVPGDFLRHAIDMDELARLDHDPTGHRLAVLRVPWPRPDAPPREPPYRAAAFGVMFQGGRLLTACGAELDTPEALAAFPDLDPTRGTLFVVQAALVTAERFLVHLRAIERQVEELESQLHGSQGNREVLELLRYQKSLVHFTTALTSNQIMLERLHRELAPDEKEILDDALVEIRQALEMTSVSSNILGQMMDAFASIISNNLNVVMKALTGITIVLAVPTVLASLYGMNVALPGAAHPLAFWGVGTASVLATFAIGAFLRRMQWL